MVNFKTIGEVSKETGIPVREIKYYIESGFFLPSYSKKNGRKIIWQYTDGDIQIIQQIKLYKELNYSNVNIKKIINTENFDWDDALIFQIRELREKKRHIENLIIAAEFMRFFKEMEKDSSFDISDFDNDIDLFSNSLFSQETEENTEQGIMQLGEQISSNIGLEKLNFIIDKSCGYIDSFLEILNEEPESPCVQTFIDSLSEEVNKLCGDKKMDLNELLFVIRFISCISLDRFFEMFTGKENSLIFVEKALEVYISNYKEET